MDKINSKEKVQLLIDRYTARKRKLAAEYARLIKEIYDNCEHDFFIVRFTNPYKEKGKCSKCGYKYIKYE